MKKNNILFFLLFASFSVSAQEVVSSTGDSYSNANAGIDFTIGEVIINTATDGTSEITQGFHQTNWSFAGLNDHVPQYEASIFPNPTEDVLNIKTDAFGNVNYMLFDAQGKLVIQGKLSSELTPVQVSGLAPGSYFLTLTNQTQKLKTFKLIKQK